MIFLHPHHLLPSCAPPLLFVILHSNAKNSELDSEAGWEGDCWERHLHQVHHHTLRVSIECIVCCIVHFIYLEYAFLELKVFSLTAELYLDLFLCALDFSVPFHLQSRSARSTALVPVELYTVRVFIFEGLNFRCLNS